MKNADMQILHPAADLLAGSAIDPDNARYAEVARHLAACQSCEAEVDRTRRVVVGLQQTTQLSSLARAGSEGHLNAEDVARYVGAPQAEHAARWRAHLSGCNDCMRAVMMYRTRRLEAKAPTGAGHHANTQTTPQTQGTLAWLRRPIPLWSALPAPLAAGVLMAFGMIALIDRPSQSVIIANYQDDPRVIFSSAPNIGHGFFSASDEDAKPYGGMSIGLDGAELRLSWPPVAGATTYDLRIIHHESQGETLVSQLTTQTPMATVRLPQIHAGKRYEWILSGTTEEAKRFVARGGFVTTQSH